VAKKAKQSNDPAEAIFQGDIETVRRLLAAGLPVNEPLAGSDTPLERAIGRGQVAIVRLLIENGADVNARGSRSDTPLYKAIHARQAAIARLLIEAGADVNEIDTDCEQQSLLMHAAGECLLSVVQALLAAGADVHRVDTNGWSALTHAASHKTGAALQVVTALLAAGARGDAEALAAAARHGSPAILRALVAAGANPNEFSRQGLPLILAIAGNRPDNVAALLSLGADATLRPPGRNALDVARDLDALQLVAVLEAAVAGTLPVAAPTPTVTADDVPSLWKRIKKALPAEVKKSLRKGATVKELKALETALGVTLPADFRASLRLVNGQDDDVDGIFPPPNDNDTDYQLVAVGHIRGEWQSWRKLVEMTEFQGRSSSPDPGVRDDWWHRGWIPFASNGGGDSFCIDLDPAEGGTVGQVIAMNHETGSRPVLAKSFAEFLALLAQRLEDGAE
jgi:cell wall assembly regulator SMI1/ankyrin repeat protein